ncbi:MAG: 23S rRNA (adenine(2503)-C(2))-methyltransferase RlmN [Rhodothermales bacterium]
MIHLSQPDAPVDNRIDLKSLNRDALEAFAREHGEPAFRGRQLFRWLYSRRASSFDEMTDLPKRFRALLQDVAEIRGIEIASRQSSEDGTIKSLFRLSSGREIETVLIPDFGPDGDPTRLTVCVSSQVGCAMACTFCATGMMGFQQNLTAGEIFDQVAAMDDEAQTTYGRGITNVVFMGMGEPLLNYNSVLLSLDALTSEDGFGLSPRRITVSTVGLARRIRQLADDGFRANLAVSLHAPSDEKRSSIMPVNRAAATDLDALRGALKYFIDHTGRHVTYEYCLFAGVNDSLDDAKALARFARDVPGKVNLIMYNPVAGLPFARTSEGDLNRFIRALLDGGITVTVRRSRGQDIDAACGQLAVRPNG